MKWRSLSASWQSAADPPEEVANFPDDAGIGVGLQGNTDDGEQIWRTFLLGLLESDEKGTPLFVGADVWVAKVLTSSKTSECHCTHSALVAHMRSNFCSAGLENMKLQLDGQRIQNGINPANAVIAYSDQIVMKVRGKLPGQVAELSHIIHNVAELHPHVECGVFAYFFFRKCEPMRCAELWCIHKSKVIQQEREVMEANMTRATIMAAIASM